MKRIIIIAIMLGVVLVGTTVYTAVKNPELTPSETISAFHEEAIKGQIEESKDYVASDILKAFENGGFPHYGSYGGFITDHKQKIKSIKPLKESINGETATVNAEITHKDDTTGEKKYYLIKEKGKWKIAE